MPRRSRINDSDGEFEAAPGPSTGGSGGGSSRHRRRARSEDHESEDEAILTQFKAESSQKVKRRRVGTEEIEEAAQPKPLSLTFSETYIKQLATEYRTSSNGIATAAELLNDAAEKVAEFAQGTPEDGKLHEDVKPLEDDLRELVDAETQIDIRKRVLDQIRADVASGSEIRDAPKRYERLVDAEMKKYQAKTARQRYAHNKLYESFLQRVWHASTDEPMPPIADFIPEEEGDGEGSDDEIAAGAAKIDYKCPLTARIFDDPVSSTVCRHSYERTAVNDYLMTHRGQAQVKCPGSGCVQWINKARLKDNPQLLNEVKNFKRRQSRREDQRKTQHSASTLVD